METSDHKNTAEIALAGVVQLVGRRPMHQEVASSVPGEGHMPRLCTHPLCVCWGGMQEAAHQCYALALMFLSLLPLPLSKNE